MAFSSWLLLMAVALSILEQCVWCSSKINIIRILACIINLLIIIIIVEYNNY